MNDVVMFVLGVVFTLAILDIIFITTTIQKKIP